MSSDANGKTPGRISRRTVLSGGIALAFAAAWQPKTAWAAMPYASDWEATAAQYLREWEANRGNHPYMGDFTRAGYRGGTIPLPTPENFPGVKVSVRDKGAKADGVTDDYDAFAAALAAIPATGGTIVVPAGRYLLSKPLIVDRSRVLVAGAGSDTTTLYFPNTLNASFRDGTLGTQNAFSWLGGQVWFASKSEIAAFPASGSWVAGQTTWSVNDAPRGVTQLTLESGHNVTAGKFVLLELDVTSESLLKTMCGDVPGANAYNWAAATGLLPDVSGGKPKTKYAWPVKAIQVSGNTVTLEGRTHLPIKAAWNPRISILPSYIHEVGIQGITIENKLITQTKHNLHPGSNGVCFSNVINGWAKDVRAVNVDVGFSFTATTNTTLHKTSVAGRASHHPYACRASAHNNMVEYFTIEEPTIPPVSGASFHGINVEGYSSGNVWRQGEMKYGVFDSHRAIPFDLLRTAIRVNVQGGVGGAQNAGPNYGCRAVHWGIEVTGGTGLGVLIDDAAPRSLVIGIRGTTAASGLAAPIPPDRQSVRRTLTAPLIPSDLYTAQREVAGLTSEPTKS